MHSPYKVSRQAVRRFLLETQLLHPQQETFAGLPIELAVLEAIRHLECVQIDPVAAVERNQHLVLAARVPGYKPQVLLELLKEGKFFEYMANAASIIPMEDFPIFQPARKRYQALLKPEMDKLQDVIHTVLQQLREAGPLPSRAFSSNDRVHGYWDNKLPKTKATSLALNLLLDAAAIRVVQREGNERYFALTSQSVPEQLLIMSEQMSDEQGYAAILDKYQRAYRVFDVKDPRFGWRRLKAAERKELIQTQINNGQVIPLEIESVQTPYFILTSDLDRLKVHQQSEEEALTGPIHFLPPLDNLLWRRERISDLFDFKYKWEIYTPAVKRQYGYYTMPILYGDRLIGRIDPKLDRENGRLIIQMLQIEPIIKLTDTLESNIEKALQNFAQFHGVSEYCIEAKKH